MNIFRVCIFVDIFGGPIKTEYFMVLSVGKRVILVFFSNFRYFWGYAKTS